MHGVTHCRTGMWANWSRTCLQCCTIWDPCRAAGLACNSLWLEHPRGADALAYLCAVRCQARAEQMGFDAHGVQQRQRGSTAAWVALHACL